MALIDPAFFPTINTSMIEPAETALKKWGADLLEDVEALRTEWHQLWNCYHAPEQGRVYALQDPGVEGAQDVKADFDAAARALGTYASALDAIKPDLDQLRSEAENFRAEALQGYEVSYTPPALAFGAIGILEWGLEKTGVIEKRHVDWENHKPAVNKNNDLLMRLDAILGRINQAENDCAETLLGIAGDNAGLCYELPEDVPEGAFVGTDAEGNGMPWGSVGAYRPSNCGDGVYWGVNDFVMGFGGLAGVSSDYDGWHWGLDTLGNTWGGMVNVVGSLAVVANPVGLAFAGAGLAGVDTPMTNFAEDRLDVAGTFSAGLVGLDYQSAKAAAESGGDVWDGLTSNYRNDPGGTSTTTVLNIASLLLPTKGLGAAGRTAAATRMLRLAEAVGLDTRMGAALGGSARLVEGGIAGVFSRGLPESVLDDMLRVSDTPLGHNPLGLADNAASMADDALRLGDNAAPPFEVRGDPRLTHSPFTGDPAARPNLSDTGLTHNGKLPDPANPPPQIAELVKQNAVTIEPDGTVRLNNKVVENFNVTTMSDEVHRQVGLQESGTRQMTASEILENQAQKQGTSRWGEADTRAYNEASTQARQAELAQTHPDWTPEQVADQAKADVAGQHPLHAPDRAAGGYPDNFSGYGDGSVNSALGAHWSNRSAVDSYATRLREALVDAGVPRELWGDVKVNVEFTVNGQPWG